MKCCAICIGDRGLRKNTIPGKSTETGRCDYCQSEGVLIIEPRELALALTPLISIYEPNPEGQLLVQWLRDDWGMFDHPRMDDARAKDLLAEIMNDGELVRRKVSPSPTYETDSLERWENLREELRYGNRFFPSVELNYDSLEELFELLVIDADELPTQWHRARLQTENDPFTIDKMGAPPKEKATHGRANPAGIPYLYLGSTPKTAVAEIRPHTGNRACVASFTVSNDLRIVDLRNPRKSVSPIDYGDEDAVGFLRGHLSFLARLGDELTLPVVPHSAAVDYVPSQYLCELIKKQGHDGVIYRSAVGDGINMALFNERKATPGAVTPTLVKRVTVEIE